MKLPLRRTLVQQNKPRQRESWGNRHCKYSYDKIRLISA